MIPGNALTSVPLRSPFVYEQRRRTVPLVAYEQGGVGLQNAEDGLNVQLWTAHYSEGNIVLSAPSVTDTVLFARADVTELDLAFDQSMRPFVAFVDATGAHYRWYDTTVNDYVISSLPSDARNPRCTLDDNRDGSLDTSDIILAYTRGTALKYRQQRDRFLTELELAADCGGDLVCVGMNTGWRLQFKIRPTA